MSTCQWCGAQLYASEVGGVPVIRVPRKINLSVVDGYKNKWQVCSFTAQDSEGKTLEGCYEQLTKSSQLAEKSVEDARRICQQQKN